jgi:hypothetical protein
MRNEIYQKLIQIARSEDLISYDDLNKQLGLNLDFDSLQDRDLIGQWLGEISEYEVARGHHMLSAVVGYKHGDSVGDPGDGFYKYARKLSLFNGRTNFQRIDFWVAQLKGVYSEWKTSDK